METPLTAALLVVSAACGAELAVDLSSGHSAIVVLEAEVDDSRLADPPGYFASDPPAGRVVRRITIENVGARPIENPDIRLNGLPLLPTADPIAMLGAGDATSFAQVFQEWIARRVHRTNDLDAARDPLAVLSAFGATFCGDDSRALGALAVRMGGEMRFARLTGHSAGELRFGGSWMLFDGDQNAFYLDWDNRTICSEADLLADPLLVLRTKVFGRQAEWKDDAAWQNAARFDPAPEHKRFKTKPSMLPSWKLLPGERISIDLERVPERVCAATPALQADAVLRRVAREAAVTIDAVSRIGEAVAMPWPILAAGDEWIAIPGREPVHLLPEPPEGPIRCQVAASQFRGLRSGSNMLTLARGDGRIRVTFEVDDSRRIVPAAPDVAFDGDASPAFSLRADGADRMWWQISGIRTSSSSRQIWTGWMRSLHAWSSTARSTRRSCRRTVTIDFGRKCERTTCGATGASRLFSGWRNPDSRGSHR